MKPLVLTTKVLVSAHEAGQFGGPVLASKVQGNNIKIRISELIRIKSCIG